MKKETILFLVIAFGAGLLLSAIYLNVSKSQPEIQQAPSQGTLPEFGLQQHIKTLEDLLASDPSNRQASVQLGHRYFDSNNPMKAIEAYDKALEIDGNDPDVLTDQAIMFRQLGWYEKAIETFRQAQAVNPQHANSVFNMGIVYSQDLGDLEKAKEAFNRFLVLVPSGPAADRAREIIEHMEAGGHQ